MQKPRLLVMSRALEDLVKPPEAEFSLVRIEGVGDRTVFLREHGGGIEAVLASGMERFDAKRLDLLPDLRLIAVAAAGMAGIDLAAAAARGIAVVNAGELNAADVADLAVAMMLAHRREIVANHVWVRDDQWPAARRPVGRSIGGERIGIVGLGHIGLAITTRMLPFGVELAWWGPRAKPTVAWRRVDCLVELADWATTLFVAARGDETSRGLISAEVIAALGADGLIVNVSRGFVIDEPAMIAALKDGRLGGAALDVFEHEPVRGSDWADVPNVLMAPHVGGATHAAMDAVMAGALDNIRRHFAGQPLLRRVV